MKRPVPTRLILLGLLSLALFGCQKPSAPPPAAAAPSTATSSATAVPQTAASSAPVGAEDPAAETSPFETRTRRFIEQLVDGDFEQAAADFDAPMRQAMPVPKLEEAWTKTTASLGKFQKLAGTKTIKVKQGGKEYDVVIATCEFETQQIDARVVYNPEGTVGGLQLSPPRPAFDGPEELYSGTLQAGAVPLRLIFHIGKTKTGGYAATMDGLDQGAKGIPFDSVEIEDAKVLLKAKSLGAEFEGTLSEDRQKLEGEFRQAGQKFPLSLKKIEEIPQAKRPQTPKPPFPYSSVAVAYENQPAQVKLAGTLTIPDQSGPHPAAIMITGSGPQDRDETLFGHKPFWVIADYLSRRGIAVLRVDDRGVGESTGNFAVATSADFAGDVLAGIEFLKTRSEINSRKIGLIGHSEGGLLAPLVAAQSDEVAFIVLLAGTGFPGKEILFQQGRALLAAGGAGEEALKAQRDLQSRMFQIVEETADEAEARRQIVAAVMEQGQTAGADAAKVKALEAAAAAQAQQVLSPWFRYFLKFDPRDVLTKVRCPVLALNGEKDLQVISKENLESIRAALEGAGHQQFEIVEFPSLNHLFQTCQTGLPAEYGQIEETIAPQVLEKIANWIVQVTTAG